jgi:hypothetical protein
VQDLGPISQIFGVEDKGTASSNEAKEGGDWSPTPKIQTCLMRPKRGLIGLLRLQMSAVRRVMEDGTRTMKRQRKIAGLHGRLATNGEGRGADARHERKPSVPRQQEEVTTPLPLQTRIWNRRGTRSRRSTCITTLYPSRSPEGVTAASRTIFGHLDCQTMPIPWETTREGDRCSCAAGRDDCRSKEC